MIESDIVSVLDQEVRLLSLKAFGQLYGISNWN